MPRKFPGVDPFIEARGYWPDFHARFITYCCDALSDRLPEAYEAVIDEQLRLVEAGGRPPARVVEPDVAVVRSGPARPDRGGGPAVAVEPEVGPVPMAVAWADPEERRESWIEIRRRPDRALVAVIELLSPAKKAPARGRDLYLAKRWRYLGQEVHLIELDLLLGGLRLPMERPSPPGDGFAVVARAGRRPMADVYAWSIRRPPPTIPVPLRPPDLDVPLDLAAVYETAFERGRYARRLDYSGGEKLLLTEAARDWVAARLDPPPAPTPPPPGSTPP